MYALMILMATPFGCAPKPKEGSPNLILIDIDTLRADHLGCYGYERDTSPNIDKFADSGVLFENAYCQMPTTGPSHASLFTSKYPRSHGVLRNGWILDDSLPTLAQILKENGYATAAFVSSFAVSSEFGYARGFDHYDEQFPEEESTMLSNRMWEEHFVEGGFDRPADATNREAVKWIEQNSKEPFFLWLHYFDPHSPYVAPGSYEMQFTKGVKTPLEEAIAKYDGEVLFVDNAIGEILQLVKAEGLDSNTLIVMLSDHGEGLGQHGWMEHGMLLYDEQTRILMAMSFPDFIPEGARVSSPVESIDILPTILDLLDVEYEGDFSGRTLAATLENSRDSAGRGVFLERRYYGESSFFASTAKGDKYAIRYGEMKYIWAPEEGTKELYNLVEDPTELENIIHLRRDEGAKMHEMLLAWLEREGRQKRGQQVDEKTRKKLEALGYVE